MHEEMIKTLPTAAAVAEYARVNGFDAAGVEALVTLWNNEQTVEEVVATEDTSLIE